MSHRYLLAALVAIGLAACASAGHRTAIAGQPVMLRPGEQLVLPDGATLRYQRVVADSRCPPDVQCIHAGDADVAFEFLPADGAPLSVTLNTARAPEAPIGGWQLRVLALEFGRQPRATVRLDPAGR